MIYKNNILTILLLLFSLMNIKSRKLFAVYETRVQYETVMQPNTITLAGNIPGETFLQRLSNKFSESQSNAITSPAQTISGSSDDNREYDFISESKQSIDHADFNM